MATDIRNAIRSYLLNHGAVSAITTTIRPGVLAEKDVAPAILIKLISNVPQEWLNTKDRVYRGVLSINAYGAEVSKSDELARVIREEALHPLLKGPIHGMSVREVSLESGPYDDEDQPKDGSDDWMRHVRQNFRIHYYSLPSIGS